MASNMKQRANGENLLLATWAGHMETWANAEKVRRMFKLVIRTVRLWCARYRQRQQLRRLAEAALKDIGISRVDALQEAEKPFWRK